MTDARFPERWLNDRRLVRLKDREFRGFMEALVWSVANRTDGFIDATDFDHLRWCTADIATSLETAGLFASSGAGWFIEEFELTQTTAAQLAAADQHRLRERDKKRRQRAHKEGDHRLCSSGLCDSLSPGTYPGTTKDRTETGQDRTGQALTGPQDTVWPAAVSPGSGGAS